MFVQNKLENITLSKDWGKSIPIVNFTKDYWLENEINIKLRDNLKDNNSLSFY